MSHSYNTTPTKPTINVLNSMTNEELMINELILIDNQRSIFGTQSSENIGIASLGEGKGMYVEIEARNKCRADKQEPSILNKPVQE